MERKQRDAQPDPVKLSLQVLPKKGGRRHQGEALTIRSDGLQQNLLALEHPLFVRGEQLDGQCTNPLAMASPE